MIRHYEKLNLIPAAARRASGYRDYDESDLHTLWFVRSARDLGFSIDEIREMLGLWQDRSLPSTEVEARAVARAEGVRSKIAQLERLQSSLLGLAASCAANARQTYPIADDV